MKIAVRHQEPWRVDRERPAHLHIPSPQGDVASRLNGSPLVTMQRRRLQRLFGNVAALGIVQAQDRAPVANARSQCMAGAESAGWPRSASRALSGSGAPGEVIQRRIGFEFETNGAYVAEDQYNYKRLVDDEATIYTGTNWKLLSDSGRMEFVSDPVDNKGAAGAIITEMTAFIHRAQGLDRNTDLTTAGFAGVWNPAIVPNQAYVGSNPAMTMDAGAEDFFGNPQVSVGVKTDKLANFLKHVSTDTPLMGLRRRLQYDRTQGRIHNAFANGFDLNQVGSLASDTVKARLQNVQLDVDALMARYGRHLVDREKLRGLWLLMAYYWQQLVHWSGSGYIKASLPVMARTDFHTIYNTLSPASRTAFKQGRESFLQPIHSGNRVDLRTTPLVPLHGTATCTVDQWYDSVRGIAPPTGAAPTQTFGGVQRPVDLASDENTIATGTNHSMGQMGLDTFANEQRAIFELRRITAGVWIPIEQMKPYVIDPMFRYIGRVG